MSEYLDLIIDGNSFAYLDGNGERHKIPARFVRLFTDRAVQAERRAIRDALHERDPADSIWAFLGEFEKGGRFEVEEDE